MLPNLFYFTEMIVIDDVKRIFIAQLEINSLLDSKYQKYAFIDIRET